MVAVAASRISEPCRPAETANGPAAPSGRDGPTPTPTPLALSRAAPPGGRTVQGGDALAGGAAAVIQKAVVAPFDRWKMIMAARDQDALEVLRKIGREEGLAGYWRGNVTNVSRAVLFSSVQASALEAAVRVGQRAGLAENDPALRAAGGAFSGLSATVLTYPLDLVRGRMGMQGPGRAYAGLLQSAAKIAHEEGGSKALFHGLPASLWGVMPYSGINFGAFSALQGAAQRAGLRDGHETAMDGACGAGAALISQVPTYPFEALRRRYQIELDPRHAPPQKLPPRVPEALLYILRHEGFPRLFRGIGPSLMGGLAGNAAWFASYGWLQRMLGGEALARSDIRTVSSQSTASAEGR